MADLALRNQTDPNPWAASITADDLAEVIQLAGISIKVAGDTLSIWPRHEQARAGIRSAMERARQALARLEMLT